jgi:hypothetical protein
MLNKVLVGACLAVPLMACTTLAPTSEAAKSPAVATAKRPIGCVGDTATRIRMSDRDCAGFGRTYTQEDLLRSGATTPGRALSLLDPSLTVVDH